nr:protein LTO1 homolog isoform X1 [Mirounga angustirostris]
MAGSQDMFDAVVMADERFHGEGYQEGYEAGNSLGIIEGRQYGTLHGAKIGSEMRKPRPAGTAQSKGSAAELGLRSCACLSPPSCAACPGTRGHGDGVGRCSQAQGARVPTVLRGATGSHCGQVTRHLAERGFRGSLDILFTPFPDGGGALQH